MKNIVRVSLALFALALAVPASAQQRPQFGLGVAIFPLESLTGTVEVYFPMRLAPNFKLEPSLGISTTNPDGPNNNTSDYTIGVGAFATKPVAAAVDLYFGGRLKLNFANDEATDNSDTDLQIAAAAGGEYYLVPNFSIGLEGQLGYFSLGDVHGAESGLFTTGLAFLRVYLK